MPDHQTRALFKTPAGLPAHAHRASSVASYIAALISQRCLGDVSDGTILSLAWLVLRAFTLPLIALSGVVKSIKAVT